MSQSAKIERRKQFLKRYPTFLIDARSGDDRFRTLSKNDILDRILPVAKEITVPGGTVLLEQKKPNFELFILLEGKLDVIADGKPVLQLKRSGDIVGEISFVSGEGCSATVFTATECTLLSIGFQNLADSGGLKEFLLSVLANKVTWTTKLKNISEVANEAVISQTRSELAEEKLLREQLQQANQTIQNQNRTLLELNDQLSEHAKELERARGSENAFLRYISHELRTPLHHIIGFASILLNSDYEPKLLRQVEPIKTSGHNLLDYINRLLDLSYLSNEDVNMTFDEISLQSYIKDCETLIEGAVEGTGFSVVYQLNDLNPSVRIDRTKIIDVFKELVTNAVKYSETPGDIVIETMTDDAFVICSVKDQGIGIPQKELNIIFDAFTLSSKTDVGSSGKGIGLAICKRIIEKHGGKIWARNNPDGGVTVYFSLPIAG